MENSIIPTIYNGNDPLDESIHRCSEYCLHYCDLCMRGVCEDVASLRWLPDADGVVPLRICTTCFVQEQEMLTPYRSGGRKSISKACGCGQKYTEIPKNAHYHASDDRYEGWYWNCSCHSPLFIATKRDGTIAA